MTETPHDKWDIQAGALDLNTVKQDENAKQIVFKGAVMDAAL